MKALFISVVLSTCLLGAEISIEKRLQLQKMYAKALRLRLESDKAAQQSKEIATAMFAETSKLKKECEASGGSFSQDEDGDVACSDNSSKK